MEWLGGGHAVVFLVLGVYDGFDLLDVGTPCWGDRGRVQGGCLLAVSSVEGG